MHKCKYHDLQCVLYGRPILGIPFSHWRNLVKSSATFSFSLETFNLLQWNFWDSTEVVCAVCGFFFLGGVNLLSFLRRNFAIFILLRMFIRYFFHLLYHYFHGRFISFPLLVSTIRSLACPCYYSLLLQLSSLIFADYSPHFSLLAFFVYSCFFLMLLSNR